jgi:hypothetical protein
MLRKTLITAILLSLFSCGFQVIYRDGENKNSYENSLAAIRIKKDRSKIDQQLKNNLYDLLNPDSLDVSAKYFLILSIEELVSPTFITVTGASGRNKITLEVSYILKNLETAATISKGSTSVNDNYNVTENRYGTYVGDEYLRNNLTKIAAQSIRNSLVNDLIEAKKECDDKKTNKGFKCPLDFKKEN